jgi:hypothetical protein
VTGLESWERVLLPARHGDRPHDPRTFPPLWTFPPSRRPHKPLRGHHLQDHRRAGGRVFPLGAAVGFVGRARSPRIAEECQHRPALLRHQRAHPQRVRARARSLRQRRARDRLRRGVERRAGLGLFLPGALGGADVRGWSAQGHPAAHRPVLPRPHASPHRGGRAQEPPRHLRAFFQLVGPACRASRSTCPAAACWPSASPAPAAACAGPTT